MIDESEDGNGFEKWKVMVKFQIRRIENLLENKLEEPRREALLEKKRRLEHELKIAELTTRNYKVLLKIQENEKEYKKLLERKKKGEFVDDLVKQNRYTVEILSEQDKKKEYRTAVKNFVEKKFASESDNKSEDSKVKVDKKRLDGFRKFEEFVKEIGNLDKKGGEPKRK